MTEKPTAPNPAPAVPDRLLSLDTYRGLIMLSLAANGFGIAAVAKKFPDSSFWKLILFQFDHPEWTSNLPLWGLGCSYWDLIQPSFMFMVGVAMPFSYARRAALGESLRASIGHATIRSLVLILMGVFLSSTGSKETNWTLVNVLTQIGLGYLGVFLLMRWPLWAQLTGAMAILIGYWWWFVAFDVAGATTAADHFVKNANAAADLDQWMLNLFPRSEPFVENSGGYATLNFVPSMVTMLFGVMAGQWLRTEHAAPRKAGRLALAGVVCLVLGLAAGWTVCPIVKRIWTPSWALFSTAYTLWILAGLYYVIDVRGWRKWTFPLVVFGTNSMLVYWMGQTMRGWTASQIKTHFGRLPWPFGGEGMTLAGYMSDGLLGPIVQATLTVFAFWLICLWLYRQRIFLRV